VSPVQNVLLVLVFASFFALLTGYIASSHGRSFWRWFGLGLILPFVSVFVALAVAMRGQLAEDRAAKAARPPGPPPAGA
jgi:hypothetical protein